MIKIKQREDKFLVDVEETWEFDKPEDAKKCMNDLLDYKAKNGRVTGFKKDSMSKKVIQDGEKRRRR